MFWEHLSFSARSTEYVDALPHLEHECHPVDSTQQDHPQGFIASCPWGSKGLHYPDVVILGVHLSKLPGEILEMLEGRPFVVQV